VSQRALGYVCVCSPLQPLSLTHRISVCSFIYGVTLDSITLPFEELPSESLSNFACKRICALHLFIYFFYGVYTNDAGKKTHINKGVD